MPSSASYSSSSSSSSSYKASKTGSLSVKKMPSPGLSAFSSRRSSHRATLSSVPERRSVGGNRDRMWDKALNSTVGGGAESKSSGAATPQPAAAPITPPVAPQPDVKAKMKQAKDTVLKALQSRMLVAVVVMLFTMVLLIALNPPMAQQPLSEADKQAGKKCKRSWKKILLWSSLPASLALLLPFCFGKRDAAQQVQGGAVSSCVNGSCPN